MDNIQPNHIDTKHSELSNKEIIRLIVNRIPKGKVASYGQISTIMNQEFKIFLRAQVVGWILNTFKDQELDTLPWCRVVAKTGSIPLLKTGFKGNLQIHLLQDEGVEINEGQIDMDKYCVDNSTIRSDLK